MSRYTTPLRYPGGKQKLAPFITELMERNDLCGGHYAEPYAGGAGVALELLLNEHASHIHLNDSCLGIFAFWRSVLDRTEDFCRRIAGASLTVREWRRQKEILSRQSEFDLFEVGFSMFYLNRCNRSGIVSGGLIGGLSQTGRWKMDARFPRNELIRRVEAIALRRKSITLRNLDAETFMTDYLPKLPARSLIYCDPPYFKKADRLYLNHYKAEDHARIARVIQRVVKHPWLVSYDSAPEILNYYSRQRSLAFDLQYNAARAYRGTEVFFFSPKLKLPTRSGVASINQALTQL